MYFHSLVVVSSSAASTESVIAIASVGLGESGRDPFSSIPGSSSVALARGFSTMKSRATVVTSSGTSSGFFSSSEERGCFSTSSLAGVAWEKLPM